MTTEDDVIGVLRAFLAQMAQEEKEISADTSLYAEGLGLDSVQAGQLAAALEERFGHDPYSRGIFPETVGDLIRYYER